MRARLNRAILIAAVVVVGTVALDRIFPPDLRRYREVSLEVLDRDGQPLRTFTTSDGMLRFALAPKDVDATYLDLLLKAEDRRFRWHPGVDPLALGRAVWQLASQGRIVSGGSTLMMQVARLLSPHRHDVLGKIKDIVRALQLEARYSKDEILAMYLTLAPMGGNLEGVRAASLAYFGHEPRQLTTAEAAILVAVPQSPTRFRPDRHPAAARAAAMRVLARLGIADAGHDIAMNFPRQRRATHAFHLADRFQVAGRTGPVTTTLDGNLQSSVEDLGKRERAWLGGDANIAAIVVANPDRSVLAYLGGVDYFGNAGMVDLARARRSPGSTLKPFIYGIAFDDALATPRTVIDDMPVRIGDYAPHNFDSTFHGAVTAREALQQSYNLPAVQLLAAIDPGRLAATIRDAGATLAFPRGRWAPSLPVALGGVGVDLADLAMLYADLADGGRTASLRFEPGSPLIQRAPLMTAASAVQIEHILRGAPLPDGVVPPTTRSIAWKTGTSYGFRDAFAVGFSRDYTVAVWVGRAEGTPRAGAFGRAVAAPLMFRIFDLLPPEDPPPPVSSSEFVAADSGPLAPALRHFTYAGSGTATIPGVPVPRILYPPNGAHIELAQMNGVMAGLALEVAGGTPPYRWTVNGMPLAAPAVPGAPIAWRPDGPGYVRLTVTDERGQIAISEVRLEDPGVQRGKCGLSKTRSILSRQRRGLTRAERGAGHSGLDVGHEGWQPACASNAAVDGTISDAVND